MQIKITDITPFMCDGDYVAMQQNGDWYVYGSEPELKNDCWVAHSNTTCCISEAFDIAPADDWTKSLIKVGENGIKSAPVPSYDEWEQLQNWADFTDDYHALREQKEIAEYEKVELKETVEALKSELKEVCDVLIRKCPEMKEWVMLNWKNLYEVQDE